MIIRDADKLELEFIRKQRISSYEEHARVIPEGHWLTLKKAISSDVDNQPGVEQIVAEVNGEVIGSVVLFPARIKAYDGNVEELAYPEIRMLAVPIHARGKGVAKALVAECTRRAKEKGYHSIGLHTGEFMENAIGLYERLGFERVPEYDFEPAGDGILVKAYKLSLETGK